MAYQPRACGWHSIVEVQPNGDLSDWPETAAGAFVHVIRLAASASHFKELAAAELYSEGFAVIGWNDVRSFDPEINDWHEEEAANLHERLSPAKPLQYSRFDTYPKEGLDG